MGSLFIVQLLMLPEARVMAPPQCMTQQYRLVSMTAQLSSTGISSLTSPRLVSAVNSSPRPGIAPQSLHSRSQTLCLLGDLCSCLGYDCAKDRLILLPFRLPQISCFTLSLKCFSSYPDNFPDVGSDPCFISPNR